MKKPKKQKQITNTMQEVAVDILMQIIFCKDMQEFFDKSFDNIIKTYNLCDDPFTHLPCTSKEYAKNSLEYQRQVMFERYGHCDGLD